MEKKLEEIQKKLTKDFLVKISQRLIQIYKNKEHTRLSEFHRDLFPDEAENKGDLKKMFYRLIKLYHPDSLKTHLQDLNSAIIEKSNDLLLFYRKMLQLNIGKIITKPIIEYTHEESYEFDAKDYESHLYSEDDFNEAESEDDIISIISRLFLGNSIRLLEPIDLGQIDGELVLSERKITDLSGLQYCTNVRTLDLSDNEIDHIFELKELYQLEELDLSNNEIVDIEALSELHNLENLYLDNNQIEDISTLLNMEKLKLLNIAGNPLTSMKDIKKLIDNEVIVIYY